MNKLFENTLKIYFLLVALLIFGRHSLAQQKPFENQDAHFQSVFKAAKAEFEQFEKTHGHFINTPNGRIHYLTWGDPAGIPLVWSHGSFTNGMELRTLADRLVKAGYYLIAIDYYGHGQTPIPDHEVSLYHVADDIKCILDELKIGKSVIGGWSRGGIISTAFYDAYPERVSGLILEDGGSVSTNMHYHKMTPSELTNRINEIFKERLQEYSYGSELEAFAAIYDKTEKGTQFDLLAWIQTTKDNRWAICPGVLDLFNMKTPEQFRDNILNPTRVPLFAESMSVLEPKIVYRNLSVPVLIIDPVGPADLFPYEAENAAFQKKYPTLIEHKIYPNTGHNAHYERPEEFLNDVSSFLIRVRQYNKVD